ncbi:MAG: NAD(+)--dinitrogen-reductase ADP-D-ribosyltransferase [Pseudomonadota bacterium]
MTSEPGSGVGSDKDPVRCRCSDKPSLPKAGQPPPGASLPFNHCELPAGLLGSLTFQRHPIPLPLGGVLALHHRLFAALDQRPEPSDRLHLFKAHMAAHFSLEHPEEAGGEAPSPQIRTRANYLRLLRGWSFDSESREGAVLKGWVESRFGLLTRFHRGPIRDIDDPAHTRFQAERGAGLYGTHALEAQLDLVYTYVQYELTRQYPDQTRLTLYRGINGLGQHELLSPIKDHHAVLLLNNLSSFTLNRERADEFGDAILEVQIPLAKVFCRHDLLPGMLRGEDEVMVIGGVVEASLT